MGKKRRALTSNKYKGKRAAWLNAVKKTETLTEQVEEAIETVQQTNKVVADKTSTIELVEPVEPVKPISKKVAKKVPVRKRSTAKPKTKAKTAKTAKTAKKTTKE